MKVFISYSSKDREFVDRLVRDLEHRFKGEAEFLYDKLIQGGDSWADSLETALAQAHIMLLVVSPDSLESAWVQKETTIALWRASLDNKFRLIPLITQQCRLPDNIEMFHAVDFTQDYKTGLERVVWGITGKKPTAAEGPAPGDTEPLDQEELRALREELLHAIELFRARPSEIVRNENKSKSVQSESEKCFIVMPFGDPDLEVVYEDFVKPIIEQECNLICERGDDVFGSNVIMDDIVASIHQADVVLADLTRKNANVFYEVGICHALEKNVLLLAQSIDDIPFDLRHRRVLLYDYSPRGCKKLERDLKRNMGAVLRREVNETSPNTALNKDASR
jgi:hypothetical protein